MSDERVHRAGVVAILGWTNVGKSSLLNRLVGDKLAAIAEVSQTTRFKITGVRNVGQSGQIVFVDTPGLHEPRSKMNRAMVRQIHCTLHDVDLYLLVVDAARGLGSGDRRAARLLADEEVPRVLVLNKVDLVRPKSRLLPMMQTAVSEWGFPAAVPVSALTGEGCDALLDDVLARLPPSEPLYPDDYLTDQSARSLAAEWIREKLLARTRAELPHATAVVIDRWIEREDDVVEIHATIIVDRPSQKQIVIGRQGSMLEMVGKSARLEIEGLVERRVALNLWVKVRADWRNDERMLREMGL
jgi:GTP-binding protein Era